MKSIILEAEISFLVDQTAVKTAYSVTAKAL